MAKKDADKGKERRPVAPALGDDEQAHPGVDHSHAGYLPGDADIRLQRAQGDSRAATPQE